MTLPGGRRRVLIYSHDTFGLGHLRRCRTIAQALVAANPDMSVLILSGSPIIGRFDFGERVDFVRIPGVIKLKNGEYTSLTLGIDFEQTLAMRAAIILHTAEAADLRPAGRLGLATIGPAQGQLHRLPAPVAAGHSEYRPRRGAPTDRHDRPLYPGDRRRRRRR